MQREFKSETEYGNEYTVTYTVTKDTHCIEGRCVQNEIFIDDVEVTINGHELYFEDLTERNQKIIMGEIEDECE